MKLNHITAIKQRLAVGHTVERISAAIRVPVAEIKEFLAKEQSREAMTVQALPGVTVKRKAKRDDPDRDL